nr:MAG TPA: hypothetical protein [Caudoviricetes sp.]
MNLSPRGYFNCCNESFFIAFPLNICIYLMEKDRLKKDILKKK